MKLLFSPEVLSSSSAGLDECRQERMGFERMVFTLGSSEDKFVLQTVKATAPTFY